MVVYQIGALQGIAAAEGHRVTHVKPHGALNNLACEDLELARCIARAVRAAEPSTDPAGAGAVGAGDGRARGRAAGGGGDLRRPRTTPTTATWCRARSRRPWCTAPRPACATCMGMLDAGALVVDPRQAAALHRRQHLRARRQRRGGGHRRRGARRAAGRRLPAVGAARAGGGEPHAGARCLRCCWRCPGPGCRPAQSRGSSGLAAVLGRRLRVPERAEPEGAAVAAGVEDLDALPAAGRPGQHAGGPDPAAQARPRPARRAGPGGQPRHPARPFVAPAQAARQVLADRPGVRRARLAVRALPGRSASTRRRSR